MLFLCYTCTVESTKTKKKENNHEKKAIYILPLLFGKYRKTSHKQRKAAGLPADLRLLPQQRSTGHWQSKNQCSGAVCYDKANFRHCKHPGRAGQKSQKKGFPKGGSLHGIVSKPSVLDIDLDIDIDIVIVIDIGQFAPAGLPYFYPVPLCRPKRESKHNTGAIFSYLFLYLFLFCCPPQMAMV